MIRRDGQWRTSAGRRRSRSSPGGSARIVAQHGPDAIGVLGSARGTNEENYVAQKFARVVLGTNNVDCCARVCHAPTAAAMKMMLGTGAATNSFDDIELARTILVCGANPTEGHPVVGARIKQAARRGANLIVVDPREIELTDFATLHLQLHPGTNVVAPQRDGRTSSSRRGWSTRRSSATRLTDSTEYCDFVARFRPRRSPRSAACPPRTIRAGARACTRRPSRRSASTAWA